MSCKAILSIIGAKEPAQDLSKSIELATEVNAHLSILVVGTSLPPIGADYPLATEWLKERQIEIDALTKIAKEAEETCRKNGVACDVDQLYDDRFILESNIRMRAMYVDLVVVGDGLRSDGELRKAVISSVTFDARTPLLLSPTGAKPSLSPKNILLAWNSRAEAARAAREALPMLITAEAVHVVLVDPDSSFVKSGDEPGADIAAFLARHGVNAIVEQLTSNGRSTEKMLQQHALELGCDMIVMGAYGHSRLRERIFGGVTASILEECPFPVFLAR